MKSPGPWYYEQQDLGFNYRFNEVQSALGISQLLRLDEFVESRKFLIKKFSESIIPYEKIQFLLEPKNTYSSYHLVVISLFKSTKEKHLELFNYIRAQKVFVQLHYWPIHLHPYYQKKI